MISNAGFNRVAKSFMPKSPVRKRAGLSDQDVQFTIKMVPEEEAPGGFFDDPEQAQYVSDQYESGNDWAWCQLQVIAELQDTGLTGESMWLGGVSEESEDSFKTQSGYYEDMKREALADLQEKLSKLSKFF